MESRIWYIQSKKKLISCLPVSLIFSDSLRRYIKFGIQILNSNRITDYHAANSFYVKLLNDPSTEWDHYLRDYTKSIIKPFYKDTFRSLIQHWTKPKFQKKLNFSATLEYIFKNYILSESNFRNSSIENEKKTIQTTKIIHKQCNPKNPLQNKNHPIHEFLNNHHCLFKPPKKMQTCHFGNQTALKPLMTQHDLQKPNLWWSQNPLW